jgi:hypothetical protein
LRDDADDRNSMIAYSSAYPVDRGIDLALVLLVACCVLTVLFVVDWVRS